MADEDTDRLQGLLKRSGVAPQGFEPEDESQRLQRLVRKSGVIEPAEEANLFEVGAKAPVRGALGIIGGVGSIGQAAGEATGIEPLAEAGIGLSELAETTTRESVVARDPEIFKGTFTQNPSFKRTIGLVGEALPSLGLGVATGGATAAALRGAGMAAGTATTAGGATAAGTLGALEGAPQYSEAREAGKSVRQSLAIGGTAALGTAALEYLPLSRILRRAGTGAVRGAAKGAVEEGVQESTQQLFQNMVTKVGYDDAQRLTEGMVEGAIAGAGSGGIVGGITGRIDGRQRAQDTAQQERLQELFGEDAEVTVRGGVAQVKEGTSEVTAAADALTRMKEAEVSNDEIFQAQEEVNQQVANSPEAQTIAEEALEPTIRPEDLGPVSATTRETLSGMNAEEFGSYLDEVESDGSLQEGERRFLQEQGPQLLGRLQALEAGGVGQRINQRRQEDTDAVTALRTGLGQYLGQEVDEQAYQPGSFPEDFRDAAKELERTSQIRVVPFRASKDAPMQIDGMTRIAGAENTIFVNENATNPHLTIAGHEISHLIETEDADAHREFLDTVRKITSESRFTQKRKSLDEALKQEGKDPADDSLVEREVLADVMGEQLTKPQTWEKIGTELEGSPKTFESVIRAATNAVERISRAFSPASQQVKDLEKAQDAAIKAFTRYARKRQDKQPKFSRLEQGATFYHGTNADFGQLNTPAWFTSDPSTASTYAQQQQGEAGANVRPVRLKLKKPYKVQDFEDITRVTPGMADALDKAGYDGMVHEAPDGVTTAVPFKSESIQGQFDPQASRAFRMTEDGSLVEEQDQTQTQANASGESAASLEAQSVQQSRTRQGRQTRIIDTRSRQERPAVGPRPEDNTLNPYDVLVEDGPEGRTILNQGAQARPVFSRQGEKGPAGRQFDENLKKAPTFGQLGILEDLHEGFNAETVGDEFVLDSGDFSLTASVSKEDDTVTLYPEAFGYEGGKGVGTRAYLLGLMFAKDRNKGVKSDTIMSDSVRNTYERLARLGVPFEGGGGTSYTITPEALADTDLYAIAKNFLGQQPSFSRQLPQDPPTAGPVVSGLTVREDVPNTDSISASLNDYTTLSGVRELPISAFDSAPTDLFYAKEDIERTRRLADEIRESGEINPLIVVQDAEGFYVLEGAHRLGALDTLGVESVPAMVVQDNEALAGDGPSFSRPKEALESVSKAGKNGVEQAKDFIRNFSLDNARVRALPTALKTVPMNFVVDMFKPRLPRLTQFYRNMRETVAIQNGLVTESKNIYDRTMDAAGDPRTVSRLNYAAATATFNQMTPWLPMTEQDWVPEGATSLGKKASGEAALRQAQEQWENAGMVEMTDGMSFQQAYKQAREAYDALPKKVQTAYQEVVTDAAEIRQRERDGLIRRINFITEAPTTEESADAQRSREDLRRKLLDQVEERFQSIRGAYLPLTRDGDYIVNVRNTRTGKTEYQFNFESRTRQVMSQRYWQEQAKENPDLIVRTTFNEKKNFEGVKVPQEFAQEISTLVEAKYMEGVDPQDTEAVASAQRQATEAVSAINQTWLQWQPDIASLKNSIQRKNVKGFDQDMMRGYMDYTIRHAGAVAYSERGFDMERDLLQMQRETRDKFNKDGSDTTVEKMVLNDLRERISATTNSRTNEIASMLGMVSSFYYMTSPSMLAVQMSQLTLTTLPHLASQAGIGAKSASAALGRATRKAFSKPYTVKAIMGNERVNEAFGKFTQSITSEMQQTAEFSDRQVGEPELNDEQRSELFESLTPYEQDLFVLRYAQHRNLLDITATHEAYDIVRKRKGSGIMHHMMYFMRNGELASRKAATLAAFDLARTKRNDDFFTAFNFAEYVNTRTLFDYSKQGKPPVMQGSVARPILQFKTFPINMTFHMARMAHQSLKAESAEVRTQARREFIGVMGMAGVLAGTLGTPLAHLFSVLDLALGDEDEPVNSRREFENILTDMIGETGTRAVMQGAPTLLGANVSRRLGINGMFNVLGDAPQWMHGSSYAAHVATNLLGPSYSVFDGLMRGYDDIVNEGDYMDGLIAATPKAVRDGLRAWQTASEGVKTGQGRRLTAEEDIDAGDLFLLAVGIYPDAIAQPREANRDLSEISTFLSERRGRLMKDFAKAVQNEDPDKQDQATAAVRKFNEKNPRFAVTSSDLSRAWKTLAKGEMGLTGDRDLAIADEYDLPVYRR